MVQLVAAALAPGGHADIAAFLSRLDIATADLAGVVALDRAVSGADLAAASGGAAIVEVKPLDEATVIGAAIIAELLS